MTRTRPARRRTPPTVARTAGASRISLRPCAPTQQPFAPTRTYRCGCGRSVDLGPTEPLPPGWTSEIVRARHGAGERTAYRCDRCGVRSLVLGLVAHEIALGIVSRQDARRLASWCIAQELDYKGVRPVVSRLQAEHGAAAWARVMELVGSGERDA